MSRRDVQHETLPRCVEDEQVLLLSKSEENHSFLELEFVATHELAPTVEYHNARVVVLRQFDLLCVVLAVKQSHRSAVTGSRTVKVREGQLPQLELGPVGREDLHAVRTATHHPQFAIVHHLYS